MAPKKNAAAAPSSTSSASIVPPSTASPAYGQTASPATPIKSTPKASTKASTSASSRNPQNAQDVVQGVWNRYVQDTPQRVKLIDVFLAFLVVVGVLQFAYCVIAGNYPFNAFLSGFAATVGQFVLTASLRIQTNPENKVDFGSISHERAFADYVFGSLILHFFCVNFIN